MIMYHDDDRVDDLPRHMSGQGCEGFSCRKVEILYHKELDQVGDQDEHPVLGLYIYIYIYNLYPYINKMK